MKFDKKYIQPIISAISIISLFIFDFFTNDVAGYYAGSLNGFTVAMNTYIGYLLILLPLILVAAPFAPKYQAKLPILSLATPVLCIVSWILCVIFAKTFTNGIDLANSTLAAGAWITLICYIALGIYAVIVYRAELKELINSLKSKEN